MPVLPSDREQPRTVSDDAEAKCKKKTMLTYYRAIYDYSYPSDAGNGVHGSHTV